MKNLAETIREARKKKGWTQGRLADEAGVSRQLVSRVENGHEGMRWRKLAAIKVALELIPF